MITTLNRLVIGILLAPFATGICHGQGEEMNEVISLISRKAGEWGQKVCVVTRVKLALADRKDIRSSYIRVRSDKTHLELAGFVPDMETAKAIEETAVRIAKPLTLKVSWYIQYDLGKKEPYLTYVGGQSADIMLKAKMAALFAEARLTGILSVKVTIQVIHVQQGKVRLYVIADTDNPLPASLQENLRKIEGVQSLQTTVLNISK